MSGIKDQENIDGLREELYKRGRKEEGLKRHSLTDKKVDVARGWDQPKNTTGNTDALNRKVSENEVNVDKQSQVSGENTESTPEHTKPPKETKPKKRSYSGFILKFSLVVFVFSVIASSVYIFFGANQISAKNVNIAMEAPFAVAAGKPVTLQLSVANQNSVPIESPVLILNYPPGTKSVGEENKNLYEERMPIADVEAGEAINVPIKVALFGEENEEKEIEATVEYRVKNSSGTFFKEAKPVFIKINSSPLSLQVDAVKKISSGQEMDITLTLRSNSPTPINDVLISANYPNTFSFINSEPAPVSGQNVWRVEELLPEESKTIKLKGLVTGLLSEDSEIKFRTGNPKTDNQFAIDSTLSQTEVSYEIEEPFIDVDVSINGDNDGNAIIEAGSSAGVSVSVTNTLDDTIYDMRVEMSPKGNLIRDDALNISSGFYDSSSKTINWEIAGMESLEEVLPGASREFFLGIDYDLKQSTASFDISVEVFARRVNEQGVKEELVGRAVAEAKYSSTIEVSGEVKRNGEDKGPVPPVAGESTDYTVTLNAQAGVNDVTDTVLTTSLPQYATWNNNYSGPGQVEYNPVSKRLRWYAGDIEANKNKQLQMQISILPSVTHVGRTLTLIEMQKVQAIDRFTNTNLSDDNSRIINELSRELGFDTDNGVVQEP